MSGSSYPAPSLGAPAAAEQSPGWAPACFWAPLWADSFLGSPWEHLLSDLLMADHVQSWLGPQGFCSPDTLRCILPVASTGAKDPTSRGGRCHLELAESPFLVYLREGKSLVLVPLPLCLSSAACPLCKRAGVDARFWVILWTRLP